MANNPLIGFADAARIEARSASWVFVLIALEALRQIHFLISEHWAGYHRFWTHRVFGGFERVDPPQAVGLDPVPHPAAARAGCSGSP